MDPSQQQQQTPRTLVSASSAVSFGAVQRRPQESLQQQHARSASLFNFESNGDPSPPNPTWNPQRNLAVQHSFPTSQNVLDRTNSFPYKTARDKFVNSAEVSGRAAGRRGSSGGFSRELRNYEVYSAEMQTYHVSMSGRGTFEISSKANTAFTPESGIREIDLSAQTALQRAAAEAEVSRGIDADDDLAERVIIINDPKLTNRKCEFTGNEIRTSKYTIITFLPINLFIQFHRVAYMYFLAIACLNQLPWLAVFGRTVSLFPLLFVLSVTAIKDGYEDWRRHRSDRKENNREVQVLHADGQFRPKKWKNVKVGEVVKVCANDTIPCDMVLLGTSDPSGLAYVQTINLDGESNLKTRYARHETAMTNFGKDMPPGVIRCEKPNRNIYGFIATMEIGDKKIPLGPSNILLRGCQLKNTDWAVGVSVYAGQETKAMQNSSGTPSKRSRLESYMNRETLWLSVFLFIMCAVVAFGMGLWLVRRTDELDTTPFFMRVYFTNDNHNGELNRYYGVPAELVISFLSSVIVFQIMIPISLYITMELVRLGQSYFMIGDKEMYDGNSDSRFQCRSLNINEDLGQIRYVFSDKTGTLTQNRMEFRNASINGVNYQNGRATADIRCCLSSDQHGIDNNAEIMNRQAWKLKSEVKVDPDIVLLLKKDLSTLERKVAHEYFLTLAACNTVVPILADADCVIEYQGESPDEQALVSAAAAYGYVLIERTSGYIVIDILGERQRFDILGLHEFDSVRKRMSVVVKCQDNSVKVLVKGADNSMLAILSNSLDGCSQAHGEGYLNIRSITDRHLLEYSTQGLRTLVLASRDINNEELKNWKVNYDEASTALIDRAALLREASSLIECNLNILGATGIEDKLQDGVPETIESLREAGIKVWVLTGDKQETAISIALSCKLITHDMQYVIINGASRNVCQLLLAEAKLKYGIGQSGVPGKCLQRQMSTDSSQSEGIQGSPLLHGISSETKLPSMDHDAVNGNIPKCFEVKGVPERIPPLALIIDGSSLVYILDNEQETSNQLEQELFDLATSCKVVVCCRVAPLQKAGIVNLIKSRTTGLTLAIGDGANDVSMIQMADVGVGISGQEGRQAVMAADFAMGQFRFLKRLLLVHGHWNYQRVAYLVLYNFYRNAVFVLMLFWYILCTAFSATSALTDWSSVFYSVIYTSVPTIVVGVLDKDLSHRTLLKHPKLYGAGHRHESYNMHLFWFTMADTLWQSLVLFYVPVFSYEDTTIDIWSMGSLWTIAVVVLVNIHLSMDVQRWVFITHAAIWGSIGVTYICLFILDWFPKLPNYRATHHLVKSTSYWLNLVLIIFLALLPRFVVKVLKQRFWPSDIQIAREEELLKRNEAKN